MYSLFSSIPLTLEENKASIDYPDIEWLLLAPLLTLAVGAIVLVTVTSVIPVLKRGGFPSLYTALVSLVAGAWLIPLWHRIGNEGRLFVASDAVAVDKFTVVVAGVICLAVFLTAMLFDDYLRKERFDGPEWYVLLLLSASGGLILSSAQELILLFVGLEILSIAVYVLAALHLRRSSSQEASFKYFILGALSSALFLYGIALTYGATGSTYLSDIASASVNDRGLSPQVDSSLILVAMGLLLVGFGFKVSAVPFHLWTPDVYQGSPTPVVAFMASGVKVAGFAAMARVFVQGFGPYVDDWKPLLAGLAVASLLVGSFLALVQTNVKRMLAYSSISHAGFLLIALHEAVVPDSTLGGQALLFYFVAYTFLVAGSFGVLTLLRGPDDSGHTLADYRGVSRTHPLLAGLLAVLLFAQAGVPFTAGFFAKFQVILAAVKNGSYFLAGAAMLAAAVAAFLYLRIVVALYMSDDDAAEPLEPFEAKTGRASIAGYPVAGMFAIGVAVLGTIVFGVVPSLGADILTEAAEALLLIDQ